MLMTNAITAVRYIKAAPGMIKMVLTSRHCMRTVLYAGDETIIEYRNHIEPYDFFTHVFMLPEGRLRGGKVFTLSFECNADEGKFRKHVYEQGAWQFRYEGEEFLHQEYLLKDTLNSLKLSEENRRHFAPGVEYAESLYLDRFGLPVRTFALLVDTKQASFIAGTPDDGYEAINRKQSVVGQMQAAHAHGRPVIAAVNGDFFDMFGDFSPSGPCVKDGRIVWAGDAKRPVLGLTREARPFIGEMTQQDPDQSDVAQAIGGMPQILKDGVFHELLLGESFGDLRHPRTAAGLGGDGLLILLVVDGRIPEHSNGASLGDLALLMREMGALDAINLDGGGSAIMILNEESSLKTMNRPADLIRPMDKLIREVFNSLVIIGK